MYASIPSTPSPVLPTLICTVYTLTCTAYPDMYHLPFTCTAYPDMYRLPSPVLPTLICTVSPHLYRLP